MTSFDPMAVRDQFPALALEQDGRPVVYLDGPGGTQVPQRVIDAVVGYFRTMNANDGGAFLTSRQSGLMVETARAAVADLLGAASPEQIHFGANMTTLTFHVSRSIGASLGAGDEIVVTTLDHEANVSPWRALAQDRDLVVRTVDIHAEDGTLDMDQLGSLLGPRTRLVAVGLASNALGTINPVARIAAMAHDQDALVFVDAVHYVPHVTVDVSTLGADLLVTSPYKWFGPHAGVLWAADGVLDRLPTYKVRPAHSPIATGTPAFELIAGVAAAVDYLADLGEDATRSRRQRLVRALERVREHEADLSRRFIGGPGGDPGPAAVGHRRPRSGGGAHAHVRHHERAPITGGARDPAGTRRDLRLERSFLCPGAHRAPGSGHERRSAARRVRALHDGDRGGPHPGGARGHRRCLKGRSAR